MTFDANAEFPFKDSAIGTGSLPIAPPLAPRAFSANFLMKAIAADPDVLSASFGMAASLVKLDLAAAASAYDKLEDERKAYVFFIRAMDEWAKQWVRYEADWIQLWKEHRFNPRATTLWARKQRPPPEMVAACKVLAPGGPWIAQLAGSAVYWDGRTPDPWYG